MLQLVLSVISHLVKILMN